MKVHIEFPFDSKIEIIESGTFSYSQIEHITIPSHVKAVCDCAFIYCNSLKSVDFEENSKLQTIRNNLFYESSIEHFSIPSCVREFKQEWCQNAPIKMNITI